MVYRSEPYKSAKTLAKEAIDEYKEGHGSLDPTFLHAALEAVFEYAQHVEERLNTMLEVNHMWDGS